MRNPALELMWSGIALAARRADPRSGAGGCWSRTVPRAAGGRLDNGGRFAGEPEIVTNQFVGVLGGVIGRAARSDGEIAACCRAEVRPARRR